MEAGGSDLNTDTNSTTEDKSEKTVNKNDKKKKNKKKDRSLMSKFERKIDDQKVELRRIYDCLMYQQCMI